MSDGAGHPGPPRIDVVGLGPGGPELMTVADRERLEGADAAWLRTRRHPAADAFPDARSFDHHYEAQPTFEAVYRAIVVDLVDEARRVGPVVYAVPGSPTVGERTVALLRDDPAVVGGQVELVVHPALSFLDLAFARLGVDPVAVGARMVDGETFAVDAAGERGPLLVAQCWSTAVLSGVKLSADPPGGATVTVLHHLGLDDEEVREVGWDELDRAVEPDHLTSLWIPVMAAPVGAELVRLDELMHDLRQRCPWDRRQTHGSLARHLMEEAYEVLEAIDAVSAVDDGPRVPGEADPEAEERAVAHLEEELGDLLFQVYFHATLAAEAGRFTLADVAAGIHDKLVSRHPHLFGEAAADLPKDLSASWEAIKKAEKGRSSVTEGIPAALPALAVAAKLQRKALAVGMTLPSVADEVVRVAEGVARLGSIRPDGPGGPLVDGQPAVDADDRHAGEAEEGVGGGTLEADRLGELLFSLVNLARSLGVDPETALRVRAAAFRATVDQHG